MDNFDEKVVLKNTDFFFAKENYKKKYFIKKKTLLINAVYKFESTN